MKQKINKREIATEAAIKIMSTLIDNYKIPVDKIFNFLDSNDECKNLLNDDNTLVCMLHDGSLWEFADSLGRQLNEQINNKRPKKHSIVKVSQLDNIYDTYMLLLNSKLLPSGDVEGELVYFGDGDMEEYNHWFFTDKAITPLYFDSAEYDE